MIDVTWQPDAESLAEGYRVYRATPAARRSQRFRMSVVGVFFLVVFAFAWFSGSVIGVFIILVFVIFVIRRMFTGGESDRRWAEAFMRDPKSQEPQRLEISPSSLTFHLGDSISSWVWPEVVEVRESPLTFTFITLGTSQGAGATRINSVVNSVLILPRSALSEGEEPSLREILQQKGKLIRDDAPPA